MYLLYILALSTGLSIEQKSNILIYLCLVVSRVSRTFLTHASLKELKGGIFYNYVLYMVQSNQQG